MNNVKNLFRTKDGKNYILPFILVTSLFFLWGFAHSILDVLNKHFQESMSISRTESALVQAVVYGGYFLMAIPAGKIISRFGYRVGVLTGLVLYGVGALLFIPGGQLLSFPFFLFSLFIIGCGLTCLETAANPYVTVLGSSESAERRINLSQSFNGLGWILGPFVGGYFIFSGDGDGSISKPYVIIGVVVLCVACAFSFVKLPDVTNNDSNQCNSFQTSQNVSPLRQKKFLIGLFSLFLYVAAQTGINSFFINYVTENAAISNSEASMLLSFGGMGLFMLGRIAGSVVMARIRPEHVLFACAIGATFAMSVLLTGAGMLGVVAFFLCYLCESIMFPTIFSLSLREAGSNKAKASSYLVMSIVGGAIAPLAMGAIADNISMSIAFVVPLVCFVEIAVFAFVAGKQSFASERQ